jgi:hypothetical protein
VTQKRYEEATSIVRKIGESNKKPVEGDVLFDDKSLESPEGAQLWHLFKYRTLSIRTLIIFFNWYATLSKRLIYIFSPVVE